MKSAHQLVTSIVTLLAACALHAADPKPIGPAMSLVEIETDDPLAYAAAIKRYNEIAKAKLNVDNFVRVFQSHYDGRRNGHVRAVSTAATISELMRNSEQLNNDPAMREHREHMRLIRKTGPRTLYQAVRFEGQGPRNSANYNTLLVTTDEPAYLKSIEDLRRIFDANGLNDVKITVWRVVAGKTDHSHRVVIATKGPEQLGALLDFTVTNPQMQEWFAKAAPLRTVVSNGTSREITPYAAKPEGSTAASQ